MRRSNYITKKEERNMPVYRQEATDTWYSSFYYTNWMGQKKKKKKEGFQTRKDAQDFERDFLLKEQESCEMSFKSMVELYTKDCKTRLKPTTMHNKQYIVNLKILPYFKNMAVGSITPTTIRHWQNHLLNHEENYSQTYLKTINNQLSAIFNFAMKYYKLPSNPVRVCGSMGKSTAESMEFWTVDEFNRFMVAISNRQMSAFIFELLFWTGIRSGELLALTPNDIDIYAHTVSITKNFARLGGKEHILEPKTPKSRRVVTMPPFLSEAAEKYIKTLKTQNPNQRLFPITKHFLHQEMERGSKLARVKRIRIHDLRHSHASLLIELGFSPLLISERIGHENIETTLQVYSHLYPNKHKDVAERLDQLNQAGVKTVTHIA